MEVSKIKQLLDYNPGTGELRWKQRPLTDFSERGHWKTWTKRFADTVAGTIGANGYRAISISGKRYYAHRIAWAIHHGAWPSEQIDHINQQRDDNRMSNLREATNQQNMKNATRLRSNTSGATGVHWDNRRSKWLAQIKHEGRGRFLGYFANFDEAVAARRAAEVKFGFFENHGRAA
jgi:hypothetical protein